MDCFRFRVRFHDERDRRNSTFVWFAGGKKRGHRGKRRPYLRFERFVDDPNTTRYTRSNVRHEIVEKVTELKIGNKVILFVLL